MSANDVVITGIGLVSSLGEGAQVHWDQLSRQGCRAVTDSERFAPFTVHPLPAIDWGLQIPKRGDQRQMELWQRLGTYAAGLALDDASIKQDEALCATMDLVVAAGGGERDVAVDSAILAASLERADHGVLLNEKLTTELRPTLFLAQLSNLLAGNISIVHKVTGSSRTFMGEEGSGVSAIETAAARIRSGQATHMLVGSAYEAEHPDMLLGYELGGNLHRGEFTPVWGRQGRGGGGVVTGSGAAFLVMEARDHAQARGARIYATVGKVVSGRARRDDDYAGALVRMMTEAGVPDGELLILSGASGAHKATQLERSAHAARGDVAVRALSSLVGHLREAQFPFAVALAALAVHHAKAYPGFDATEVPYHGVPGHALAMTVGYHYFEGMVMLSGAGPGTNNQ